MTLKSIQDVRGRFLNSANQYWWAYRIAIEYHLDPREVKNWNPDDVLEALAAIKISENSKPPKK